MQMLPKAICLTSAASLFVVGLINSTEGQADPMNLGTCTLPNSRIANTGIYERVVLPSGPIPGQTEYLVCNEPGVWNFAEDLKVGVSLNPYRGWTLMGVTPASYNSTTFVQVTNYVEEEFEGGQVILKGWKQSIPESMVIGIFDSGTKPSYVIGEILPFKKGMAYLHPGGVGGLPSGNVVRWQGAFTGAISVVGSVFGVYRPASACGNGTRWALLKNNTMIASGEMIPVYGDGFRLNSVSITPADSIYFVLDPKGEAACDGVALDLEIRRVALGETPVVYANGYE